MSAQPAFRFVQASNLLLDRFCSGPPDLAPQLQRLLVDAPFHAAERVFDAAMSSCADFLILAGGSFQGVQFSTWGASFLARQCERLQRRGIHVYWAEEAAPDCPSRWPSFVPKPANLHLVDRPGTERFQLDFSPHVRVELCLGDLNYCASNRSRSRFRIAASPTLRPTNAEGFDYWAIRGGLISEVIDADRGAVRTAGSPQGRTPTDLASGACLIVDVAEDFSVRTTPCLTAPLRWHAEEIVVDDAWNWDGLRRHLQARAAAVQQRHPRSSLLLNCVVRGHGPVIDRVICIGTAEELGREVSRNCTTSHSIVHVSLQVEPDAVVASRWRADNGDLAAFSRIVDRTDQIEKSPPPNGAGPHFRSVKRTLIHRLAARALRAP